MLIRRLKERCAAPELVCVGTSATMVASRDAMPLQRRETVPDFASQVFGRPITEAQVIEETLEPFTQGGTPTREELAASLTAPLPAALPEFRRHPLARWSEGEFGVEPEEGGRLRRRVPRTLTDAASRLAEFTGATPETCQERLRAFRTRRPPRWGASVPVSRLTAGDGRSKTSPRPHGGRRTASHPGS
jgi:hypothetical protein